MAKRKIITTTIGTLRGRDCVFLDRLSMSDSAMLVLEGTINTGVVRQFIAPNDMPASGELPYTLTFRGVLAVQVYELDTWESQEHDDNVLLESSFEEIVDSPWIASLQGKITPNDRHFRLMTYDDVVDVICRDFELVFDPNAES